MLTFTPNKRHELKLQLEIFLHLFDNMWTMGKWALSHIAGENKMGRISMRASGNIYQRMHKPLTPQFNFLGIYPTDILALVYNNVRTRMFTGALFVMSNYWVLLNDDTDVQWNKAALLALGERASVAYYQLCIYVTNINKHIYCVVRYKNAYMCA